jgi:PTH1 family peptidyl-tRNA hydrolase
LKKEDSVWLIVGLGNPGEKYDQTRHNIGFACVKALAQRHGLAFDKKRSKARIAEGNIRGERVVLAKPFTYMNLSGQAVVGLANWYKIDPKDELLVIYDDMDVSLGKIRLRRRGSPGTHNGMKSIVQLLGTQAFNRLRVGIGAPPSGWDAAAYVLSRFTQEEQEHIPALVEHTTDAVDLLLTDGITAAMDRYNAKDLVPQPESW